MAANPDEACAQLIQPTAGNAEPGRWNGVLPTNGLTHLMRMAVIVLILCIINLILQISLSSIVTAIAQYGYLQQSSAIWAVTVAMCAALYMTIVTKCAKSKSLKYGKTHVLFGLLGSALSCGFLMYGIMRNVFTTYSIGAIADTYDRNCLYFGSDGSMVDPPPGGGCRECSPTWADIVIKPESCCCCNPPDVVDRAEPMMMYGVKSCDAVYDSGYPIVMASSVLYSLSLVIAIIMCVATFVVVCWRCYSCSGRCGPFSAEGGVCCRNPPYNPAAGETRPGGWSKVYVLPTKGLAHVMRMSVIVLVMSMVNLSLQIWLVTIVSSTGYYSISPSNAIWAAAIALCSTLYMTIVTKGSKGKWMKHANVHMVFALVGCGLACGFIFTGMVLNGITASNIGDVPNSGHSCVYMGSDGKAVTPPPGGYPCGGCDPSMQYTPSLVPDSCCCCASNGFDAIAFYGVKSCETVLEYGYPIAVVSSVLYGLSFVITILLCITTCVVRCCRCYRFSESCGPFSEEGGVCCRNPPYGPTNDARVITANYGAYNSVPAPTSGPAARIHDNTYGQPLADENTQD